MALISNIYQNPNKASVAHDVTASASENKRRRDKALPIPKFISDEIAKAIYQLQDGLRVEGDHYHSHKALNILRQLQSSIRKRSSASR